MTRILTSALAVLFLSGAVSLADDAPCVKCQRTCCAEKTATASNYNRELIDRLIELKLLLAEIDPGTLEELSVAELELPEKPLTFRDLAANLLKRDASGHQTRSFEWGVTADGKTLCDVLHALKERGAARIIARPCIVTLNGSPAIITIGGEVPIVIPSEHRTLVTLRQFGHQIQCLPTLIDDETVCLQLSYEASSIDFQNGIVMKGCTVPGTLKHHFDTSARLRFGESVVLGGVLRSTNISAGSGLSCLANGWNCHNAFSVGMSGVQPSVCVVTPFFPAIASSLARCPQPLKEFVILATVNVSDPDGGHAGTAHLNATPTDSGNERSIEVTAAIEEADSDEPHRPAILLTPTESLELDSNGKRPHAQLSALPSSEESSNRSLFDANRIDHAGLEFKITCKGGDLDRTCQQLCCEETEKCERRCNGCCANERTNACRDADDDDDDDDDDDADRDDDDCCQGEIDSFISQVLQAQMQYLDGMMRCRLEHERQLLQAKAEAESVIVKRELEHAQQIQRIRTEHLKEIQEMNEQLWATRYKAVEARHQQALEHQREMFALKQKHTEELQSERIASLEAELRSLRSRANRAEPERVTHSPDTIHQSSSTRRSIPTEMPIQVEELASGLVRYAPVPPKPDDVLLNQPHDVIERIEFSTPPISTGHSVWQEIECLRREIGRLRVIVEDMLCDTPDFPPNPVPESPLGDCENM